MELMHPELRRGLAEEHASALSREMTRSPSPGAIRRFVARFASRNGDQASNASLTSLSASSLCSRRTAIYETESRPRPRAAA
jgi:hypothetical protein